MMDSEVMIDAEDYRYTTLRSFMTDPRTSMFNVFFQSVKSVKETVDTDVTNVNYFSSHK